MKICFICKSYNGGFKSFIDNMVSLFVKNGFIIDVLNLGSTSIDIKNAKTISIRSIHGVGMQIVKPKFFLFACFFRKLYMKVMLFIFKRSKCIQKKCIIRSHQIACAKNIINKNNAFDMTDYDCVISSEEIECNYFLSYLVKAKRKICYVHPDYIMAGFDKFIDKFFFKKVDAICTVSFANASSLKKAIPSLTSKIYGVPNPIDVENVINMANKKVDEFFDENVKNIITVCRLDNTSKALDRLVAIAKRLKGSGQSFCWRIVGDGPYKDELISLISRNNLQKEVVLTGFKSNPLPLVKESDLFVLQSYYEGYPISVCESLIVNTPVLLSDFPAAKELIENGKNGLIAKNDANDIFEKLSFLLASDNTLLEMKNNLSKSSKDSFSNIEYFMKVVM